MDAEVRAFIESVQANMTTALDDITVVLADLDFRVSNLETLSRPEPDEVTE